MKLSEAQALAEQAIYDYTSSTKWQQVKYMTWTTAEIQDVIAKALVKNIDVIHCCTQLKDKKAPTFEHWLICNFEETSTGNYIDFNNGVTYRDKKVLKLKYNKIFKSTL